MEESVEVDTGVFPERNSERICELNGMTNVTKISSQDRSLQRTVEQMLDGSVDRVQQQNAEHVVDEEGREKLTPKGEVTRTARSGREIRPRRSSFTERRVSGCVT